MCPWLTIVVVAVGLGVAAVPAATMTLGMPSGAVAATGSQQRVAYDQITAALGEGQNAPLVVAVRPDPTTDPDLDRLADWADRLAEPAAVSTVRLMGASPDHSVVLYQVVPRSGPTDPTTVDLVSTLRATSLPGADPTWSDGARLGVTGMVALNIDLTARLAAAIGVYLTLVVGLSLVVLFVVLRSVLVPAVATAGFLLSIGATMGLVVVAFSGPGTWLVGVDRTGPILSFLPIMATGVLYGLAMDYQVFLGTSTRDALVAGAGAREAVAVGFRHAGRVVVAAAAIMVSVFAGFVASDDTTIRQFGLALAIGILLDAFVVRMTFMPAVLHLAGDRAWWVPRRPRSKRSGTRGRSRP